MPLAAAEVSAVVAAFAAGVGEAPGAVGLVEAGAGIVAWATFGVEADGEAAAVEAAGRADDGGGDGEAPGAALVAGDA